MKKNPLKFSWKKVVLGIGFMVFTLWITWGNTTIEITHITIEQANIPESFDEFKIAHVSDLHNKNWDGRLIQHLQNEQPDMIAITGDLIDSQKIDVYAALDFVERAKDIAPVYYVTGNQEAVSDQNHLLEHGLLEQEVPILKNEALEIGEEAEVLLLGLHDPLFMIDRYPAIEHPVIVDETLGEMSAGDDRFKILLSHRPELFETYVRHEIDLVLAGHAHGGQFRLPFIGGLYAPDQGFFPIYTSGVYEEAGTSMVVSRGLGNSVIPVRFNNRPELLFITLNHSD